MKYFFLLFLISMNSFAETEAKIIAQSRKTDYQIDWQYKAGQYLIYDCERRHYACVDLDGNSNCEEERSFAIEKKATIYPCAPLSKFANKKSCVEKNYKIVDINALRRFCYPK
jgi:hypothetical protein